jgi:5-formyltetrahydrofolate cyclo-ligase
MAVPSPICESELLGKQKIRREALQARSDYAHVLDAGTRQALEQTLAELVLPHILTARIVAGYHPMADEISPTPLLTALSAGQTAALPWFADRDSRMLFRTPPAVETGPWGMLQPSGQTEVLAPDVVIVPLVRADRIGTRIGRGKGHYDQALSHLREVGPILTIGIAWEIQIADEPLPTDAWDIALDAIATPAEWIDCRRNRAATDGARG